jgi:hypothetical protein
MVSKRFSARNIHPAPAGSINLVAWTYGKGRIGQLLIQMPIKPDIK